MQSLTYLWFQLQMTRQYLREEALLQHRYRPTQQIE
jgi:hypothetical protein